MRIEDVRKFKAICRAISDAAAWIPEMYQRAELDDEQRIEIDRKIRKMYGLAEQLHVVMSEVEDDLE